MKMWELIEAHLCISFMEIFEMFLVYSVRVSKVLCMFEFYFTATSLRFTVMLVDNKRHKDVTTSKF
jgi:hypothetical protein